MNRVMSGGQGGGQRCVELFSKISTTLRNFDSESNTVEADSASLFAQTKSNFKPHMVRQRSHADQ